jgi:hypothetical protein
MTKRIKFWQQLCNVKKPYTVAGFEPGTLFSGGGRDDHCAKAPWRDHINTYVMSTRIKQTYNPEVLRLLKIVI